MSAPVSNLSHVWKDIRKSCILNEQVWKKFLFSSLVKVFLGIHTLFWHDLCAIEKRLCFLFPSLYRLAILKDCNVADGIVVLCLTDHDVGTKFLETQTATFRTML